LRRRGKSGNVGGDATESTVTLSRTIYNSIGRVEESINELRMKTRYFYDEMGQLVETDTIDANNDVLTVSRTLYDADGRVLVSVGPYDPNDPANVGTENVYDSLGRVIETRR